MEGFLFILIAAAIAFWAWWNQGKRRKELEAWVRSRGFRFDPSEDYGAENRYPDFGSLRNGDRRYAFNRWEGEVAGRKALGFDYHYQTYTHTKHGRQTHHHYFSTVVVDSPVLLKPLFIRPEGLFDKVTEFFGYDDIDFESSAFSRAFYVKAPEKRWAFDVLHARAMEHLLAHPRFALEFAGLHVFAYRSSLIPVAQFDSAVAVGAGLLAQLPEYVLRQQTGAAGNGAETERRG